MSGWLLEMPQPHCCLDVIHHTHCIANIHEKVGDRSVGMHFAVDAIVDDVDECTFTNAQSLGSVTFAFFAINRDFNLQ